MPELVINTRSAMGGQGDLLPFRASPANSPSFQTGVLNPFIRAGFPNGILLPEGRPEAMDAHERRVASSASAGISMSQGQVATPLRWAMAALLVIVAAASNQRALCNQTAAAAELLPSKAGGGSGNATLRWMATAPRPQPASSAESALLMTLGLGLISLAAWSCSRRCKAREQRQAADSSLLPRPRFGASSHERLQDATYLRQILEVELTSSNQQLRRRPAASASSPSAELAIATNTEACEPPATSSGQPQADAPP